ncbi:M48 family metalloprotease [Anaerocolumna sedimenticola]|uniref:M48 family metalloprotease n=1 Tax=Anaerocolumna sedimenticola TaxID=2696063 RepID=A0A6P1TF22_9FIRM|nr:M56 family metallopeptidase [Anaerocolumna sedimenticola]QHQ59754.1 M48 family metalloprotease [Anaerocolumna sedimenticola]
MKYLTGIFTEILYLGATSSILILLILMVKKVFHKTISPKWHYYIWVLLLIRLLIPYSPESSLSVFNLFNTAAGKINIQLNERYHPIHNVTPDKGESDNITVIPNTPVKANGNDVKSGQTDSVLESYSGKADIPKQSLVLNIMAVLWLAFVLILTFLTVCLNLVFAAKVKKNYTGLKDERISRILNDCKYKMNIRKPIELLTAKKLRTPSLYVMVRPKILVSKSYLDQLSDTEIEYIFLHELSHYKRRDVLVNWILAILQIVYFFDPFIWYAFYKIHEDCEISCDAEALRYINEEEYNNYGSTIIKLIKLFSESNFIPATAGIGKNKSSYKRRILMISKYKKSKWSNTLLTVLIILTVALVGLTGCKKTTDIIEPNTADSTETTETTETADTTEITGSVDTSDETVNSVNTTQTEEPLKSADLNESNTASDNENNNGSKSENNTDSSPNETKDNNSLIPAEEAPNNTTVAAPEEVRGVSDNKQVYYGDWMINKVLAYGSAGTYSKKDAEKLVGKSLSFTDSQATSFGDDPSLIDQVVSDPVYTETEVTANDFISNYRMSFDRLGIKGDSAEEISVTNTDVSACTFLIKDDNTLILIGGGTYFELTRITLKSSRRVPSVSTEEKSAPAAKDTRELIRPSVRVG